MKIGILQTAYKKAEDYGAFYNVQELGLARAVATLGHEVVLYKAVDGARSMEKECNGKLTISFLNVRYMGINGLVNTDAFDNDLDCLIYFSDTQLKLPSVYKWCKSNNIIFIPYVGVVSSHSENRVKRVIMNFLSKRNLAIYRRCPVLAKTPDIKSALERLGCHNTILFPVGLDETVMNKAARDAKHKNKRILFVGRMEEEKHPDEMVYIYDRLLEKNRNLELTMIGDGYMYDRVKKALTEVIERHGLTENQAVIIRKVRYEEMYKYYTAADVYINLNRVEILGMSILESMYYGCPCIAISAPGPDFILNDGDNKCGVILPDSDKIIEEFECIVSNEDKMQEYVRNAYDRIQKSFVWSMQAKKLMEIIKN